MHANGLMKSQILLLILGVTGARVPSGFTVVTVTWLTVTEYLCRK